jgi:hypothetical protein
MTEEKLPPEGEIGCNQRLELRSPGYCSRQTGDFISGDVFF